MKIPGPLLALAVSLLWVALSTALWVESAVATGELAAPAAAEESAAANQESAAATHKSAAPANENVARAVLTSDVVDREPVDDLESLTNDSTRVYFFTELHGLEGTRVTHKWEYQGKTMSEVHLSIGGPRWRIWSSKNLDPTWLGHWKVSLVSEDGVVLASDSFIYAEK